MNWANLLATDRSKAGAPSSFKAKSVIDVVVYRGGDAATASAYTALTEAGLAMGPIAGIGAMIAGVWAFVAVLLGRSYTNRQKEMPQGAVAAPAE